MSEYEYEDGGDEEFEDFDLTPASPQATLDFNPTSVVPKPDENKQRYSTSLIEDYNKCPASAYGRITKQPQTKGIALAFGSAIHYTIEQFLKTKGQKLMVETFPSSLKYECDKNEIPMLGEDAVKYTLLGNKMIGFAQQMLSHPSPKTGRPFFEIVDPELVEKYFRFEHNGRTYSGKIDLIQYDGPRENHQYSIVDWKTGKNSPNHIKLKKNLQFSFYAKACQDAVDLPTIGHLPNRITIVHLRGKYIGPDQKKINKENPANYQYNFADKRTEEQIKYDFAERVEPVVEQMENGVWYRIEDEHCGWCGFFDKKKERCTVDLPTRQKIHAEMESKA